MSYKIYVESTVMGTRLALDEENVVGKKYCRWAVEDSFNGLSLQTVLYKTPELHSKCNRIGDYIYGFYEAGSTVTLKLYTENGVEAVVIKNVKIL